MPNSGFDFSPEEVQRALAERPKHPLTHDETEGLREVLAWFSIEEAKAEARQIRKETTWKRIPVIFGSISGLSGIVAFGNLVWNYFFPHTKM